MGFTGLGFGVWGSGFRVWGLGFGEFRVERAGDTADAAHIAGAYATSATNDKGTQNLRLEPRQALGFRG